MKAADTIQDYAVRDLGLAEFGRKEIVLAEHDRVLEAVRVVHDGEFALDMVTDQIVNVPAGYHGGAGGVTFADGHAETCTPQQLGFIPGSRFGVAKEDLSPAGKAKTRYYYSLREAN